MAHAAHDAHGGVGHAVVAPALARLRDGPAHAHPLARAALVGGAVHLEVCRAPLPPVLLWEVHRVDNGALQGEARAHEAHGAFAHLPPGGGGRLELGGHAHRLAELKRALPVPSRVAHGHHLVEEAHPLVLRRGAQRREAKVDLDLAVVGHHVDEAHHAVLGVAHAELELLHRGIEHDARAGADAVGLVVEVEVARGARHVVALGEVDHVVALLVAVRDHADGVRGGVGHRGRARPGEPHVGALLDGSRPPRHLVAALAVCHRLQEVGDGGCSLRGHAPPARTLGRGVLNHARLRHLGAQLCEEFHKLRKVGPRVCVALPAPEDHELDYLVQRVGQCGALPANHLLRQGLDVRLPRPGVGGSEHLEHEAPEGVAVALLRGLAVLHEELGRRKGDSTGEALLRADLAELLGDAKVGDLGIEVSVEEHVGRLDVAVDDALVLVEVLEAVRSLLEDAQTHAVREGRVGRIEGGPDAAVAAVFHHQEQVGT
mmetsp:Transcript_1556/g.4540  ORF Transcript_1556/g.4540 Transcript_1556/m.4540 type:complete len:487 (+) Transcript_1556:381-1841(+)